jgi:hypothetical protein
MSTPELTAEASLARAREHYRQVSSTPPAAEFLGLTQLGLPELPFPTQPVARSFNYHGKWCGIGNSGPGTPIDAVDEVCCRHDQCYCENGYLECECDRDLLAAIPGAIADPETPQKLRCTRRVGLTAQPAAYQPLTTIQLSSRSTTRAPCLAAAEAVGSHSLPPLAQVTKNAVAIYGTDSASENASRMPLGADESHATPHWPMKYRLTLADLGARRPFSPRKKDGEE